MENVLFLINHAGKAGTERYVQTLVENAANYGVRPFFAYDEPGRLSEKLLEAGVTCRRIVMRSPFDIAAALALARLCGELQIDVIHTNYLRENYIAILSRIICKNKPRVVYTNHFVVANGLPIRIANRLMTRANHRIISVCEAGAPRLVKNGNVKRKIMIIHNAVDPLVWRPGADYRAVRERAREELGLGVNETVFLCASRFAHDKGHKFLIDSLARLAAAHGIENLRVLLAGDGPLEAGIRAQAESLGLNGAVNFIGFASDMKSLFYASDVYVNPSQHEALSFLIIEALASGLPVIAADMGGNREIVNERNGCGILIKYGDTEALCAAIQTFRTACAAPAGSMGNVTSADVGANAGNNTFGVRTGGDTFYANASKNALLTVERDFSLDDMLAKTFASFF